MINFSVHIELNSKLKNSGRTTVMLRISKGRKEKKRISTGIHVRPSEFNNKAKFNHWIRTNHSMHSKLNSQLKNLVLKAENAASELESKKVEVTLENIVNYLRGVNIERSNNFIDFYYQELELMKSAKRVNSYKRNLTSYNKLREYMNNSPLYFDKFDLEFIKGYENYLKSSDYHTNTIAKELSNLRSNFRKAAKNGLIDMNKNPFANYSIKRQSVYKAKLSYEEILKIENLELDEGSIIDLSRDIFIAQFYLMGARFGDLAMLKQSNIKGDRLVYQMSKTSLTKSVLLLPPVKKIILKYRTENEDNFLFPLLPNRSVKIEEFEKFRIISSKNSVVNKYLKKIGSMINTSISISTHLARHSYADFLRKKGVDVYLISCALGHSDLKTTRTYLSELDQEGLDASLEEIFG